VEDEELRPDVSALKIIVNSLGYLGSKRFQKFSSWKDLIGAIYYPMHMVAGFGLGNENSCYGWHTRQWNPTDRHKSSLSRKLKKTPMERNLCA